MRKIDRDLDRILTRLRDVIRERSYTQLEVQEALGWSRSHISQMVNRQKPLRVEHVLMILKVIGVEPEVFYDEIYRFNPPAPADGATFAEVRRLRQQFDGLANALTKKGLITASELVLAFEEPGRRQEKPPRRKGESEPS